MGTDTSVGSLPRTEEEKRMSEEICKNEKLEDVKFWFSAIFWAYSILSWAWNVFLAVRIADCIHGELPFVAIIPFALLGIILAVLWVCGFRAFMEQEKNLSV